MNDTGAQASTSAPVASSEEASSSTRAEQPEDIGDALGPSIPAEEHAVEHICFLAKHASTSTEVRLSVEDTIAELKAVLYSATDIPPERIKILGLARGKLPSNDDTALGELQFPPASLRGSPNPTTGERRITISIIGTPIDQTFRDPGAAGIEEDTAGGLNDVDYSEAGSVALQPVKDRKSLEKLRQAISRFAFTFPIMNEPREGRGLLVLDLDYTLADTKALLNHHGNIREACRPGLQDFLAAVYPAFDLCIWSATSWRWLEAKLTEMDCLTSERYKISFVLDKTPMFNITVQQKGQEKRKHQVKALQLLWSRFPRHYGPHNTIHIDDLSRNFAFNPSCGLKIKPYKHSPQPDTELAQLQDYLIRLANRGLESFEVLGGHKHWKKLLKEDIRKEKEKEKEEDQAL